MTITLKPIPFDKSSKLTAELDKELKANTYLIKDALNDFNKSNSIVKKELVEYFMIINEKELCRTILLKDNLPGFLITFLETCFDKVQSRFI